MHPCSGRSSLSATAFGRSPIATAENAWSFARRADRTLCGSLRSVKEPWSNNGGLNRLGHRETHVGRELGLDPPPLGQGPLAGLWPGRWVRSRAGPACRPGVRLPAGTARRALTGTRTHSRRKSVKPYPSVATSLAQLIIMRQFPHSPCRPDRRQDARSVCVGQRWPCSDDFG